ncbi:MAG: hypothetical protein Q8Q36_01905 [bacterium]|nr:hypothetical protein [bacterium]
MEFLSEITMLPVHIGAVLATLAVVLYADHLGFQYFRGRRQTLDGRLMFRLHRTVWAGLIVIMATGFIMFWPARETYLSYAPFLTKMGFVAIIVVNAFFIGKLLPLASGRPFAALTEGEKRKLLVSGAFSSIGWVGALSVALWYLGYEWTDILFG